MNKQTQYKYFTDPLIKKTPILTSMYPPVSSELIFPVEAASAEITRVRPLPGMDHGMAGQVVLLREALPAHVAVERLLAAVGPHVIQELTTITEPAPANVTRAGLLPVGRFHVDPDPVT